MDDFIILEGISGASLLIKTSLIKYVVRNDEGTGYLLRIDDKDYFNIRTKPQEVLEKIQEIKNEK